MKAHLEVPCFSLLVPSGLLGLDITYTATAFTSLAATRARAAEVAVVVVQNWVGGESKDRDTLEFSEEDNNLIKVCTPTVMRIYTSLFFGYHLTIHMRIQVTFLPFNILLWIFLYDLPNIMIFVIVGLMRRMQV